MQGVLINHINKPNCSKLLIMVNRKVFYEKRYFIFHYSYKSEKNPIIILDVQNFELFILYFFYFFFKKDISFLFFHHSLRVESIPPTAALAAEGLTRYSSLPLHFVPPSRIYRRLCNYIILYTSLLYIPNNYVYLYLHQVFLNSYNTQNSGSGHRMSSVLLYLFHLYCLTLECSIVILCLL